MFAVIVCYKCGRHLLAKASQKTKNCPYCSARLNLVKVKKLAYAKTAQEASCYLRALKSKRE